MKSIAVFFGGVSVEHDVSVLTGVMTLNSIDKEKFNPIPIYVSKQGEWFTGNNLFDLDEYKCLDYKKLKKACMVQGENVLYQLKNKRLKKIENIFCGVNCLHGERGEDGTLKALLDACKVPMVGAELLPASLSMDKAFTKSALKNIGVQTVKGMTAESEEDANKVLKTMSFPLIVKPNALGSSIGVCKASNEEQLKGAIRQALRFGEKVVIEPFLQDFTEINCAVYRGADGNINVSACERPIPRDKILSFGDKYKEGKREFPAKIEKVLAQKIANTTRKIYTEFGFDGVIRIDYFIVGGKVLVNEINSVPGSLAYYLFFDTMKGFSKMLTDLIYSAEKKFLQKNAYVTDYNSGILTCFGSKGAKHL